MKRIAISTQKILLHGIKIFSKKYFLYVIFGFLALPNANAQNGEALYKQTCSACHSIGGGRLVGPDLKGINTKRKEAWLVKWITGSTALIKSGDADAKAIFDQFNGITMPDQKLADADVKAIIAYIGSQSPAEVAVVESKPVEQAVVEGRLSDHATAEEIAMGQNLFEGRMRFSGGGPACLSCHNVDYDGVISGGLLAKDLTTAHTRLGGDAGIKGILGAPPFPAMTQSYLNKALTEEEIFAITAFLYKVDSDKVYQHPKSSSGLLTGGLVGLGTLLCTFFFIWNNRKQKIVKQDILNRQIKSI